MRKVRVSGADISLYHVAARELGDALQWWRIAQVNGLSDYLLSGPPVEISIPEADAGQSSGLPIQ